MVTLSTGLLATNPSFPNASVATPAQFTTALITGLLATNPSFPNASVATPAQFTTALINRRAARKAVHSKKQSLSLAWLTGGSTVMSTPSTTHTMSGWRVCPAL